MSLTWDFSPLSTGRNEVPPSQEGFLRFNMSNRVGNTSICERSASQTPVPARNTWAAQDHRHPNPSIEEMTFHIGEGNTVVRRANNHCIIRQPRILQRREHLPNPAVHIARTRMVPGHIKPGLRVRSLGRSRPNTSKSNVGSAAVNRVCSPSSETVAIAVRSVAQE